MSNLLLKAVQSLVVNLPDSVGGSDNNENRPASSSPDVITGKRNRDKFESTKAGGSSSSTSATVDARAEAGAGAGTWGGGGEEGTGGRGSSSSGRGGKRKPATRGRGGRIGGTSLNPNELFLAASSRR